MSGRIFILISIVLFALWGCQSKNQETVERSIPVRIMVLKPDSISVFAEVSGNLQAGRDALVFSKISERLVDILKPAGSRVSKNEVIVRLNNTLLKQAKLQAAAGLKSAQARYRNVADDYERYRTLYEAKAISIQQWQKMQAAMQEAKAALQQMQAAYAQAEERYEDSYIKAPFAGIVGSIFYDVGQMVPMGRPIAKIINPHVMKAKLYVPDLYFGKLKIGQWVSATFPTFPDRRFKGRITRLDPAIDPVSRTFLAEVTFDNHAGLLTSGLYGIFKIRLRTQKGTLVVPDNALLSRTVVTVDEHTGETQSTKKYFVFKVEDQRAHLVPVKKGLAYGDRVEILNGLKPGDQIIVVGQFTVKDGQRVAIRQD